MGTQIKMWLHWTDWGHVKDMMGEGLVPFQARSYELTPLYKMAFRSELSPKLKNTSFWLKAAALGLHGSPPQSSFASYLIFGKGGQSLPGQPAPRGGGEGGGGSPPPSTQGPGERHEI